MSNNFDLSENIKAGFVATLIRGFKSNLEYTYNDNADITKVTILEAWDTDIINYPTISIECSSADLYRKTIGDYKEETTVDVCYNGITYNNINGIKLGGTFTHGVTVTIAAESPTQRDRIGDWASMYLRYIFTNELIKYGLTLSDIKKASTYQVVVGNDPIFLVDLSCEVIVDWEEQISVDPVETISGICQTTIIDTLPNGATYSSD